ncbi:MAG TPA: hypothetical protein VGE72_31755 [Azospirillum sp.]
MSEKLNDLTMKAVDIFAEAARTECNPALAGHMRLINALGDLIRFATLDKLKTASSHFSLLQGDDRRRIEGRALALAQLNLTSVPAQFSPVRTAGHLPLARQPSGLLAALNTRGKPRR